MTEAFPPETCLACGASLGGVQITGYAEEPSGRRTYYGGWGPTDFRRVVHQCPDEPGASA